MDPFQERIKYYTEWVKILWLTLIADVGGIVSLLLRPAWSGKIWLILVGGILAGGFLSLIIVLHLVIEKLMTTREENNA